MNKLKNKPKPKINVTVGQIPKSNRKKHKI